VRRSLKLPNPEELKLIKAIDMWEVCVNRSWNLSESVPGKSRCGEVKASEARSPELD
jgi:hypothetical protein